MQFLRKIFFYVFAAIYVVFCPLIIMYSLGYIYRPGTDAGVVKTGLIYLSSAPPGADVYLNGKKYAQKTPTVMQELLPGDHSVRMKLEGYRAWERKVPVEAEKATVLDKVILLRENWDEQAISKEPFTGLKPVPRSGYFLVSGDGGLGGTKVFDYRQEQLSPLLEEGSPYAGYGATSSFVVRGSACALVIAASGQDERALWMELSDGGAKISDVTDLFGTDPGLVLWLPRQEDQAFMLKDNSLVKIDVKARAIYPDYLMGVKGAGLFNNEIYYIKEDNTLDKIGYDKKVPSKLMDDPDLGRSLFGGTDLYRVEVLSEDYILFLGGQGELLANRLPYRFVDKGVKGFKYYEADEQVLLWTAERIGVLDLSEEETGSVEFEKGPGLVWERSGGKDIEQCFWVYKGSHVLYRDGSEVFLLAIEEYGDVHQDKILDVKPGSAVYYSDQTGKVYFLAAATGLLSAVELVPHKSLISVPFPKMPDGSAGRQEQGGRNGEAGTGNMGQGAVR